MQEMTTTKAARKIGEAIRLAQRAPVTLTVRGSTVAVLCSPEEWAELHVRISDLEARDPIDHQLLMNAQVGQC